MSSKWFTVPRPNPQASLRLFCFPYAGGSSIIYRPWAALLPNHIELIVIELPGHHTRIAEPLYTNLMLAADELGAAIRSMLDRPAAFFGYSMGALMAHEVAQRLYQAHDMVLNHLFVAACRAPELPATEPPSYNLPADAFRERLIASNGTPPEVLNNRELYGLMEPILRADFQMCNTYQPRVQPPLPFPVTVFGGLQDPSVAQPDLAAWKRVTTQGFRLHMLPGDHFFLTAHHQQLVEAISRSLEPALHVRPWL